MRLALDVLRSAQSEIGYVERPVNVTKFAAEAGHINGRPWCATFLVAMMRRAGVTLPSESAYTPTMANGFKRAGRWLRAGEDDVRPGDVAFYQFPGSSRINHVGIVVRASQVAVECVEGNTAPGGAGSQTNGGGVYRRTRPRSYVAGFGRPYYLTEITPMYAPPLLLPPIVAFLPGPCGAWLLAEDGAVYAFGVPYFGAPNGQDYFLGRKAAQLEPFGAGYTVVASSGERYDFPAT